MKRPVRAEKRAKRVEVMLDVAREGNLTLDLATVIPQAGWVPAYDVRLAADAKTAELTFRAMVRQQTGEDWNNVDLTLSTARPAAGGAPPELYPWHIALFRPPPPMMTARMPPAAPAPVMAKMYEEETAMLEDALAEEAPAVIETAELSNEQSSVAFHIPRPLDIPSDGSQHGSVVAIEQLPVSMEFVAIPKLSPLCLSQVRDRQPGRLPAPAGQGQHLCRQHLHRQLAVARRSPPERNSTSSSARTIR